MAMVPATRRTPVYPLGVGCALVAIAVVVDVIADGDRALETDVWSPTWPQLVWTASIAAGVGIVYGALWVLGGPPAMSADDPTDPATGLGRRWRHLDRMIAPLVLAGVLAVLGVGAIEPRAVDRLSREDHFVEWLSATMSLATAVVALLLVPLVGGIWRWGLGVAALAFAWVGLEEISYFQRILDFSTPETLSTVNDQGEANLHNAATDVFQNLYYLAVAVLFTASPLVYRASRRCQGPTLAAFVPSRIPIALAVGSVAFTYASTSYPAHHMSVWMAFWFVLVWTPAPRSWRVVLLVTLAAGSAMAFLIGDGLPRDWALSEYRELVAAMAFAVWMVESSIRIRHLATADRSAPLSTRVSPNAEPS